MDDDAFVLVARVDARVAAQRERAGLHDDVVVGDGFLEQLGCFERVLEANRVFHRDFDGDVEVRDLALGQGHPLGDGLAHRGQFLARAGRALARRHQAAELEELLLADEVVDVALGDAAFGTGAAHVRDIDAGLLGGAARQRRGAQLVAVARRRRRQRARTARDGAAAPRSRSARRDGFADIAGCTCKSPRGAVGHDGGRRDRFLR